MKAGNEMQDFIIEISNFCREKNPNFILIPQNGAEICFQDLDAENGLHQELMQAIDGIGIEELFYNGNYEPDQYRLDLLKEIQKEKKVLISDYVSSDTEVSSAINISLNEGFICFPRISSNYDYLQIPNVVVQENNSDILSLKDAKNYLYLISNENFSSKSDFLNAVKATNFDLVLIDLFFGEEEFTSSEIQELKTKQNGGKRLVISYVSIGSAEKYRFYWKKYWALHHPLWLKKRYEGYKDEFWVKFWKDPWKEIMYKKDDSYFQKILNAGFDGA